MEARTPMMVDIAEKPVQVRVACAEGRIKLKPETIELVKSGKCEKGDPFQVATLAAILAVKKTPEIVPLAHPIPIEGVEVHFGIEEPDSVTVRVTVRTSAKTGVEMEALVGVTAALLAIWDVVKKYEKDELGQYPFTRITDVFVVEKVKR